MQTGKVLFAIARLFHYDQLETTPYAEYAGKYYTCVFCCEQLLENLEESLLAICVLL